MRHIVDAIAAQGRNGDDTLVHVSKKELRMMKNLGDRLGIKSTTNPRTGLPEAFNWLGTLGGIAGGVAGTFIAPGAGTAAGAAMGSAAGTAAGGGTLKQSLTTGLISGVTAYAGGAALGSMSEAGAGLGSEVVADAAVPAVTDAAVPAVTDATASGLTTGTADVASGGVQAGTTDVAAGAVNQPPATAGTNVDTGGVMSNGADSTGITSLQPQSSAAPEVTPTPEPTTTPQDTGIKGPGLRMPQAGDTGGLKPPAEMGDVGAKVPEGGGIKPDFSTPKSDFSFKNVGNYLENTPTKDVVKQYGADLAKTAVGQGMAGMMPVGSISQPEAIAIPGKKEVASPKVEFYQGPEGELRTRAVPAMAQGGLATFADYDAADAQADGGYSPGGPIGYASGGAAGAPAGGITTIPSTVNAGNQTAKTGNVLPAGFFSKEEYAKATPEQRAAMDRLMAAQREMTPSPMRRQGYAGGGGIGMVRSMQPGGQWGDMTADMYGAVQEQKPQWLQSIEPGGFIGATVPGKMDYEDKKRAEEDAKKAEEKAKEDAAKAALAQQEEDRLNKVRGGSEIQQPGMAAGGIASFGRGRYLQGPGDGMSDSIPARIDGKQEARLATNEFVVPADVVSHIGNGSSDAGAKELHAMMDRIRQARTGTKKQGKQVNPRKYLPA